MAIKTVHLSNLAIPPGEFLEEEIEARGLSRDSLAAGLGLTVQDIDEIICGERAITPKTAEGLDEFLGLAALFWLNSEARYRLTLANNLEIYGHANPFDGPESEWPQFDDEPLSQEETAQAASPGD